MTDIQIQQAKGQLEASVAKVEPYLTREEFEDYCDNLYTCAAYLTKIKSRIKNQYPLTPDEAFKSSTSKSNEE